MAKWILNQDGWKTICSSCGKGRWKGFVPSPEGATEWMRFCPQCGEKMDGSEEKTDGEKRFEAMINGWSDEIMAVKEGEQE